LRCPLRRSAEIVVLVFPVELRGEIALFVSQYSVTERSLTKDEMLDDILERGSDGPCGRQRGRGAA